MRIRPSIRGLLIGWGLLSTVTALVLAGFGFIGVSHISEALTQVVRVDQALRNHNEADAFMDDTRADVLRALQAAVGTNQEGKSFIRDELDHHQDVIRTAIAGNRALPLPAPIHDGYGRIAALLGPFIDASSAAVELALSDPVAGAANFEHFRGQFVELEDEMDTTREQLRAIVRQSAASSERTAIAVHDQLEVATIVALCLLAAVAAAAILAAQRMTNDLTRSREAARHLSRHDTLTGLANRALLAEHLGHALEHAHRYGGAVAMLCLDLDRFKQVNDTLGHPVGDMLLREVAGRLHASVRACDTVARLGGDEFAIIQAPIEDTGEAGSLAHRLVELLCEPYDLGGHQVVIGASIGIAFAPADTIDADVLLKMADMALYRSKTEGRGQFRLFEPAMNADLQARRVLELDLRNAIAARQFTLHYQPLVEVVSGKIIGFEALVRWQHPQRGLVPPGEFIPLAEETGLIVPLGEWVLRQACVEAAGWPGTVLVAVNLSAVQFRGSGLAAVVVGALEASGLPPGRLELEITETALLTDAAATLAVLRELRALGVRISMDDFGTGYSSLGYLRSFPFDKIKIDQCFVREIETSADCKAIVRAVTGLGCNLGITTTAEGVETLAQFDRLREEGCDQVQGYYFSRPVPADQVPALLTKSWPAPGLTAATGSCRQAEAALLDEA